VALSWDLALILQKASVLISNKAQIITHEFEKKQRMVDRIIKIEANIFVLMFESQVANLVCERIRYLFCLICFYSVKLALMFYICQLIRLVLRLFCHLRVVLISYIGLGYGRVDEMVLKYCVCV